MNRWSAVTAAFCVAAILTGVTMAAPPTTRPAGRAKTVAAGADDFVVSKMRVQTLKEHPYFYKSVKTTLATMGPTIQQTMDALVPALKARHVQISGPPTFVYKGAGMDHNAPFELEMGFQVEPGTEAFGDYKVKQLDALTSATVIYSGPIPSIGAAYQQVYPDLFATGLVPSGERRETYLMWEGPESVNNVVLIQIGVKP